MLAPSACSKSERPSANHSQQFSTFGVHREVAHNEAGRQVVLQLVIVFLPSRVMDVTRGEKAGKGTNMFFAKNETATC